MVVNLKRSISSLVALTLAAALLSACGSEKETGAAVTARELMSSDITLQQPAGPKTSFPLPESSVPTKAASNTPKPCAEVKLIPPKNLMSVAPFAEPKRFEEFSEQGAADVVAYYTYATYYSFVKRDTSLMRRVFTNECTKCAAMADWVDAFVAKNAQVQTGIPTTDIIDVYGEKLEGGFAFWVVAQNREPAILGCDAKRTTGGYDAPSTSKSLYRVESVQGKNLITGIYKVPEHYR